MSFWIIASRPRSRTLLWSAVIALALGLMIRADLASLRWTADLSAQGSPPPARDAGSATGYVLEQRHFLGSYERGETYRWIAAAQELLAEGPFRPRTYDGDTVPEGRPQLLPRLYTLWVAAVAEGVHLVTGMPLPIAAEKAALWEPLLSHALAFVLAVGFMARRFGAASAAATALVFVFLPSLTAQFVPGALTPHSWALLLAAYAIAASFSAVGAEEKRFLLRAPSAIAASLALWLDPACGFPAVLVIAAAAAAAAFTTRTKLSFVRWSLIGSGLSFAAWLFEQTPWAPTAGELRFLHPLYALAWLGLGLALEAGQQLRSGTPHRKRAIVALAGGGLLVVPLGFVQVQHGFPGWFHPTVWMRRITSLDETRAFETLLDWVGQASAAEVVFLSAPALAAILALLLGWRRVRPQPRATPPALLPATVAFAGLLVLAFFRVRWSIVVSLAALPVIALVLGESGSTYRRVAAGLAGAFLLALFCWDLRLPAGLQRPTAGTEPSPADVEALLYRHFAHWLASHAPGQKISALAPPELSDSIVFHGGGHVLMSTAWESYPGQLAARRILSSLESTEAEAVVQGHQLTHLILPSWDKVLPLFVQAPTEPGRDTLYDRLRHWRFPAFLRPIPYRLPPTPVYAGQTLAVFKVTPPQDEPLLLSRLAEYFVEMDRREPAAMVARVLAEAYPDDPNAAIGRAIVYAEAKQAAEFEAELTRLAADVRAGRAPFSWDRRVQRAIVLALGRQRELARSEIETVLATATAADLLELTPLQAYRLRTLAHAFRLEFSDAQLSSRLAALGAEYQREK